MFRREVHQNQTSQASLPMSADAAPWSIADNHDLVFMWATHRGPVQDHADTVRGALNAMCGHARNSGAIQLYSVNISTAVDASWLYVTATGSAAIPLPQPSTGSAV
jgi:hypothetical protein